MVRDILRCGIFAVWIGSQAASCAQAAVFVLANGGQIEGELLNPQQQPRLEYVIQLPMGGRITLVSSQVDHVLTVSDDLRWYEQWRPKVPDTVEGHWTMAEECRQRNLKAEREHHLNQILRLDPDHRQARYGLGFSRPGNQWVKTEQWMQDRGYIRYQGSWRTPQDVALEKANEQVAASQREWRRQIRIWRSWILGARGREQEALERLRAIDDPAAAAGLVDILKTDKDPRALRMLCIEVLGRLQTGEGVAAFIDRALVDADANIRDACLDQLRRFGSVAAMRAFQAVLESPDNAKVRRAGYCLGVLGEPEATLPLINALVTEHKFALQTGGGPGQMNVGFGGGPGGGGDTFGVGGRPQIIKQDLRNESVLSALVALWPGVNFGYDKAAWRAWFAERQAPPSVNLRRDH